jgi:hypothetical protein
MKWFRWKYVFWHVGKINVIDDDKKQKHGVQSIDFFFVTCGTGFVFFAVL